MQERLSLHLVSPLVSLPAPHLELKLGLCHERVKVAEVAKGPGAGPGIRVDGVPTLEEGWGYNSREEYMKRWHICFAAEEKRTQKEFSTHLVKLHHDKDLVLLGQLHKLAVVLEGHDGGLGDEDVDVTLNGVLGNVKVRRVGRKNGDDVASRELVDGGLVCRGKE